MPARAMAMDAAFPSPSSPVCVTMKIDDEPSHDQALPHCPPSLPPMDDDHHEDEAARQLPRVVSGPYDEPRRQPPRHRPQQRMHLPQLPRHPHLVAASLSEESSCSEANIEDKYRIDPLVLGRGHHGSVRACVDRSTLERCAVKSIRKSDPSVRAAGLAREIALLREMRHDNVVELRDVYEDDEYVHLVTDLCEGGELFDAIVAKSSDEGGEAPCFEEARAAEIARQILTAIQYLHERDVVHRDVKPENVLFSTADPDAPVKLIDFGLSRKHAPRESPMKTVVGTPYYVAPEVLRKRYDRSCDLWSVGVIAYILLCGYPPFNGADGDETHKAVLRGKYSFPREDWKHVGDEAIDFVEGLLRLNPKERMTAAEALEHPWIAKHARARPSTCQVVGPSARAAAEAPRERFTAKVLFQEPTRTLPSRVPPPPTLLPRPRISMTSSSPRIASRKLPAAFGNSPPRRRLRVSEFGL
ncbi:hypothetical protein ACHAWF_011402 [Thalassiosira exigua]